jgi:hypothetical protein
VVVRERWDVRPERRRVLRPRRREDPSGRGHDFDGPLEIALLRCSPSTTLSCANPMLSFGVAAAPPPCPVHGCSPDYFAATGSTAIDGTGHLVFA